MTLGEAIKCFRRARGLTLVELAKKVKSHEGNLSRIERNNANPSLDLLYRLAETLETSVGDLFQFAEGHMDESQVFLTANFSRLARPEQQLLVEISNLFVSAQGTRKKP
ncbi:helix-turn-helix domain-containing protein [Marinobacter sp.]|uniref:helix-turn-helix domain-containing protein n=1 Tax=Marinobacter sp. TaxID=50741 RepID=UPI00384A4A96